MKSLGILGPGATVFPRLPNVPAWNDLPPEEKRKSARRMQLFAAMVENMDANIGKLIGYLKTAGLYDNTLIIFLSDNGPEGNIMEMGPPWDNSNVEDWGKKGTFIQYGPAWAQVGAGPFRMFKGLLSEGGIRAPLINSRLRRRPRCLDLLKNSHATALSQDDLRSNTCLTACPGGGTAFGECTPPEREDGGRNVQPEHCFHTADGG